MDVFGHLQDRVVLARTENDPALAELEELIIRLRTWDEEKLADLLTSCVLCVGYLGLKDGGVADHQPALLNNLRKGVALDLVEWSVLALRSRHGAENGIICFYAVLNVGREGWCVLTSNLHTLVQS